MPDVWYCDNRECDTVSALTTAECPDCGVPTTPAVTEASARAEPPRTQPAARPGTPQSSSAVVYYCDNRSCDVVEAMSTRTCPQCGEPASAVAPSQSPAAVADTRTEAPSDVTRAAKSGWTLIGAAVAVFVFCAIVQAACGSSMFHSSFRPTSTVKDLLLNITFWPGWTLTGGLGVAGLRMLLQSR